MQLSQWILPAGSMLLFHQANAYTQVVSLPLAQKTKGLTVNITGSPADTSGEFSSHYGKCIRLECKNQTGAAYQLKVTHGDMLYPEDTNIQAMVVTADLLVNLGPGQSKTALVYAMCSEASDGSPGPKYRFNAGAPAKGNLYEMAGFLWKNRYQGNAAQQAVWCITDNRDLSSVYCEDTAQMYGLRRKVVQLKKLDPKLIYASATPYHASPPVPILELEGNFHYEIRKRTKVKIAIYDPEGNAVQTLTDGETQDPGEYTYTYTMRMPEPEAQKPYYLRMYMDGVQAHQRILNSAVMRKEE